ncbi:MAG: DUF1049 domain-containing protein [Ignavibacterium album]|uniref:hypothetical protein n=1 Tax=Ignavibacterium album TaxID=591197 RepID=UPI0026EF6265|nr:hypothetical protein [Ignavibacterium album]MBI5660627.1 DUF1049 domain-containing protein [Ignavibacterium album]
MRYIYLTLIVIITIAVLLFKFQNLESVTISFLSMSITLPTSFLVFIVYILGMLTGGSVVAFIKTLVKKSKAEDK